MQLVSLDLSNRGITELPVSFCNMIPQLRKLDLSGNNICPPYLYCMEYISDQDISACGKYSCPEGFIELDGGCYMESHIDFLQSLIDSNSSLAGISPLELSSDGVHITWKDGRLDRLIMRSKDLTMIPEDICSIHTELSLFDVSDNAICAPYPSCIDDFGKQNTVE